MKKILLTTVILFTLPGCMSLQPVPLKNTYLETPYEIITDKHFDEVWSDVIDLFATKGLSIKVIDKSSGLIVSEKTSFISNYTFEDRDGNLDNPEAWIVLVKMSYSGTYNSFLNPTKVSGEWNIRIKSVNGEETLVNVNLTNIEAVYERPDFRQVFEAKSTGNFEKLITEFIKN